MRPPPEKPPPGKPDQPMDLPAGLRASLQEGEVPVALWRPSFWKFSQQFVLVGLATSVFLGFGLFATHLWHWLVLIPASIVIWGFIFDDWRVWFDRRPDRWLLTDRRLLYFNPSETDRPVGVMLDQISSLSSRPWLVLGVRLSDGTRVDMKYLPWPDRVRAAIERQRRQFRPDPA